MNIEEKINDLGVNAITGVRLLELLDISTDELQIPQRFSKIQDIIKFLSQYSEDTQQFLINKATRGKQVDKLQHFHEYIHLLKKKAEINDILDKVLDEKNIIEATGDTNKLQEIANKEVELRMQSDNIGAEIRLYEK